MIESGAMSLNSLSLRFNTVIMRLSESIIDYFCDLNFDNHIGIGVLMEENGEWKGVASGRIIQDLRNPTEAEWAALVIDEKHGQKIGSCILYYLSHVGMKERR